MDRENFNTWLFFKPAWKEISWEYTTGRNYQHPQDLKAVFWNSYNPIEQKFEIYYKEFHQIPYKTFDDLIFTFRQHFPPSGRAKGINYFDDLIEMLIAKHKPAKSNKTEIPREFREWFKTDDHYTRFINIMVDQKKYLDRQTLKWSDGRPSRRALAIAILRLAKESSYFRPEIKPEKEDYGRIANDVWGLNIGMRSSTLKSKPKDIKPSAALPKFPEIS